MDEQAGTAEGSYWTGTFTAVEGNGTTIQITYQNNEWDAVTVRLFQCHLDGTQTEVLQWNLKQLKAVAVHCENALRRQLAQFHRHGAAVHCEKIRQLLAGEGDREYR